MSGAQLQPCSARRFSLADAYTKSLPLEDKNYTCQILSSVLPYPRHYLLDSYCWYLHDDSPHHKPNEVEIMDDFASETDSDYTSYWRDWVSGYDNVLVFEDPLPEPKRQICAF